MMRLGSLALLLVTSACSGTLFTSNDRGLQPGDASIGVALLERVPSGDSLRITVTNVASHSLYFARCGSAPTFLLQQYLNGAWTRVAQGFDCAPSSQVGPIELAAGMRLAVGQTLNAPGHYRFTVVISGSADLSAPQVFFSVPFDLI